MQCLESKQYLETSKSIVPLCAVQICHNVFCLKATTYKILYRERRSNAVRLINNC